MKTDKTLQTFEELLAESLRFHGMLTPVVEEEAEGEIEMPQHLAEPDLLFAKIEEKKSKSDVGSKVRLAAFKGKRKKK
jgi:hypothetical protein